MQIKTDNTLENVRILGLSNYKNITVFPIIGKNNPENSFKLISQALDNNQADISEVSEEGSVNNLYINNKIVNPILIIDGETLTDKKLKQNRIAAVSTLIDGQKKTMINVLCSEKGRWSRTNRRFASRDTAFFAKGRFSKMASMQENMHSNNHRNYHESFDQNKTWENIDRKFNAFNTYSDSSSMQDIYESIDEKLNQYLNNLTMPEKAIGAVFAINNKILGFEMFSNNFIFKNLYPKILKSYVLDALEKKYPAKNYPGLDDAKKIIDLADNSMAVKCKNQGIGNLFTIDNKELCATVLMYEGEIIHFSCFSKKMQEEL